MDRIAVVVAIGITVIRMKRQILIYLTVAVIIDAVAYLSGARFDARIRIVTVKAVCNITRRCDAGLNRNCRIPVGVAVGIPIIDILSKAIINQTVAVIILTITDFRRWDRQHTARATGVGGRAAIKVRRNVAISI